MALAATPKTSQDTFFTHEILGRYICNGLDEAMQSSPLPFPGVTPLPNAHAPFDIIIIGGGMFGLATAQHLFATHAGHGHRILVLEAGSFMLAGHVQNLPMLGLNPPDPTSIAKLRLANQFGPGNPRNEVWGLPWHSATLFPGLAYCIGGRSLYWGGWSPQPLDTNADTEMPRNVWPNAVVADLNNRYFREASDQIGVAETNDFIFGALQNALRDRLFQGIGQVPDAIPLANMPDHPAIRFSPNPLTVADLLTLLGLSALPAGMVQQDLQNLLKLEAPLAVQGRVPRAGFFPLSKFSSVPLLIAASRAAWSESGGDDTNKRLMMVPRCHVKRLVTQVNGGVGTVTGVETEQGTIALPPNAVVLLALGTIENARLALNSFQGITNYQLIGQNLMTHLRSNLTIRIPRAALANLPNINDLQAAALFLKGRRNVNGVERYFHLQITASGLGPMGTNAEAMLFQAVPDIDKLDALRTAGATNVVITIRAVGEMEPQNQNNFVRPDPELDEAPVPVPRAFVSITRTQNDSLLFDAMDSTADEVARIFAGNQAYEVLVPPGNQPLPVQAGDLPSSVFPPKGAAGNDNPLRRDGLGTTFHEAGTLWMGANAGNSVTNTDGKFHYVNNAYVLGPALFPTIGSGGPVLTGIALARRTADSLP